MAEIKQAIIKHFMNNADIVSAFANRITADKFPDLQAYPRARVWVVNNDQKYHMQGEGGRNVMVQIDMDDDDISGADTNAELLRLSLSGFKGQMGNVNAGMVKARIVNGVWDETTRSYRRIIEVEVLTND